MTDFGVIPPPLETASSIRFRQSRIESAPLEIYLKLRRKYRTSFLLESATGPRKLAEYSFIGFDPDRKLIVHDGEATLETRDGTRDTVKEVKDPFQLLRTVLPKIRRVPPVPRFAGGAVGHISYEGIQYFEDLHLRHHDATGFPDLEFGIYSDGLVFDHRSGVSYYFTFGNDRLDELEEACKGSDDASELAASGPSTNLPQTPFEEAVKTAKDYIYAGDIFQVVLSRRTDLTVKGDLGLFYRALRSVNPSPYMYFLTQGDRQIIGSSPEMLVRVEDQRVETFPIAGTRPVVPGEAERVRLAEELRQDPKERAEHLMLVDLARNDLGRVSKFGSIRVEDFMNVQRFSHVQHMVSRVTGELREGLDAFDAMRAVFPAGTVSGAPKVRAMEIIDELEPSRRGPYAGAVGYFSCTGDADFAITIRTLLATGDRVSVQAGAGIVADSIPEREFEETEKKAAALLKALALAEKPTP